MPFEKGKPRTGGRAKGTPNKTTQTLKQSIEQAFDKAGGVRYLVSLAEHEPKAFATLLAKCLPREITGPDGGPIQVALYSVVEDAARIRASRRT